MEQLIQFGNVELPITLPDYTDILTMGTAVPLREPRREIAHALENSCGSAGLAELAKNKLEKNPHARAVVVISDNTRPVPNKGEQGILWPVVERLLAAGMSKENILILVATGTHRSLTENELKSMLDERVFSLGIPVVNHDCRDTANLVFLGETSRGSKVYINRLYVEADLKILTGLVESHFMAGASGGRKSVCPGLIGEESTYIFHGASMLAHPNARDLVLEGNPCHEEALEVAKLAGVDYIVNVTLDHHFQLTGVFAGDLEKAHEQAVESLKKYVAIPVDNSYDIIITHGGFVGLNHYQVAKAAVAAIPLLKPSSTIIAVANTTDADPVGSKYYRTVLHLLKLFGAERFHRLIMSPDWTFVPEQWQVQMWAKVFQIIPQDSFIFFSPQICQDDYQILPGIDGNKYLPVEERYQGGAQLISTVIDNALQDLIARFASQGTTPTIAFLSSGPYGIPLLNR